ncbi:MAG: PKD domain-containing protein [Bacteroidota bacterium]
MKKVHVNLFIFTILFLSISDIKGQDTLRVLFLGNSYTSYNNLPQLVKDLSTSAGKNLITDVNMPGGITISGHLNDPTSIAKVSQGNWDYVVVQEQSQLPTIDYYRYNDMYPSLTDLKMMVEQFSPCAKLITYMTWGRRYGGQQCDPNGVYCSPVFTGFNHMQDSLTSAYMQISDMLNIQCAPVGVAWQQVLNDTNLVLHSADNSHPNMDGSYLAACAIYSSIWKVPSSGIAFNAGIAASRAAYYQSKSDQTVFNLSNDWNLTINQPEALFTVATNLNTITCTNQSSIDNNAPLNYTWLFGDGTSSNLQNPTHTYANPGSYTVTLVASNCIFSDTLTLTVQIGPAASIEQSNASSFNIFPNPTQNVLSVTGLDAAENHAFQIFDVAGRPVLMGTLQGTQGSIDVSSLSAGIYVLHINNYAKKYFHIYE